MSFSFFWLKFVRWEGQGSVLTYLWICIHGSQTRRTRFACTLTTNYELRFCHNAEWSFLNKCIHLHKVHHYSWHLVSKGTSKSTVPGKRPHCHWTLNKSGFPSEPFHLPLGSKVNFVHGLGFQSVPTLSPGLCKMLRWDRLHSPNRISCCARPPTCSWAWEDIAGSKHRLEDSLQQMYTTNQEQLQGNRA